MRLDHDCARVERDCVDLHQGRAEAIRRLVALDRGARRACRR